MTAALELDADIDLRVVLRGLALRRDERWWWAVRTADGPATVELVRGPPIRARAWGPGAEAALARVPGLVGLRDDTVDAFAPGAVAHLVRQHPELRIGRTGQVIEALVEAVLGQRVTGRSAMRSWRSLRARYGDPAPGPEPGLLLGPDPERLAQEPSYALHGHGVERRRAETVIELCRRANRLRALLELPAAEAAPKLASLQGIGPWSLGHVLRDVWGDPDAVPLGDYHLPHLVAFAFSGAERGTDEELVQHLAPWAGHRARVVRLVEHLPGPPRRAPRGDDPDYRRS